MVSVRPVNPAEWPTYRDLRLRALLDSPQAFGSTHEAEAPRADAVWADRLAEATSSDTDRVLFALDDGLACGLIWCRLSLEAPVQAHCYQMWVDPASRGKGAGRALLQAAVAWAAGRGADRVLLGATAGDTPAMRLYRASGFRPIGGLEPLREHSDLRVQTMVLALGPAA